VPIPYQPTMAALGVMAPVLGPWFSGGPNMPTIPALPANNGIPTQLHVSLTLANNWLPPATGNLSLYLAGADLVPPALDGLRHVDGSNPFASNGVYGAGKRLVAWFRLLPEVEERLHQCMALMPAPTAQPLTGVPVAGQPSRPQVRSFMLVFPPAQSGYTWGQIDRLFDNQLDADANDTDRPNCVGLTSNGTTITGNTDLPMTHLRRPGGQSPDKLLAIDNGLGLTGNYDLWCFDRRGRPIDPGAVACWWSWLMNYAIGDDPAGSNNFQLLAPNLNVSTDLASAGSAPNTVPMLANFAPGLTAHLVDPHEGPLGAPFLAVVGDTADTNNVRRLTASAAGSSVTPASGAGLVGGAAGSATGGGIVLGFTPAPTTSFPAPAAGAPNVSFNPPADNAPLPRLAVLPNGPYAAAGVTLWPGGPLHTNLTRDFVRVAVVDEEAFLIGIPRRRSEAGAPMPAFPDAGSANPVRLRREMDQNRPSTRITVAASAGPVLRTNSGAVAAAMLGLASTPAVPARLVLGVADTAWGAPAAPAGQVAPMPWPSGQPPLPATLALTKAAPGSLLPAGEYRVLALQGDGGNAHDRQLVLVQVNLGPNCAGVGLRAWPLGFAAASGQHVRLTGGFGTAGADNIASLVMQLPAGVADAEQMLMDLLVTAPGAGAFRRHYAARPFQRPQALQGALVSGNPVPQDWVICETGAVGSAGGLPVGSVPAGAHVVALGSTAALVDRTTIPNTSWASTLYNTVSNNPTQLVSLTRPAYGATPDRADSAGRALPARPPEGIPMPAPAADASGPGGGLAGLLPPGYVHLLGRSAPEAVAASRPFGLMDRLEVAGASLAAAPAAVIGGAPAVPWALEPPGRHFLGYPGVPAAIEVHGTGAVLAGPAAVAAAEYVRERTAGMGVAGIRGLGAPMPRSSVVQSELALLMEAVLNLLPAPAPAPAAPAGPSQAVAVLRTGAAGLEGVPGAAKLIDGSGYYPTMTRVLDDFYTWANQAIPVPTAIPGGPGAGQAGTWLSNQATPANNALAVTRALDRRLQSNLYGSREGLHALLAAIGRAQDLIYIETPELDGLAIESGDGVPAQAESLSVWKALLDRMATNRALRLVICLPVLPAPGTPEKRLQIRNFYLLLCIAGLRASYGERVAVFSPGVGGGRSLRLATTSVVVDDAWALTGTTHLSRRGLSWDSSLAVAVFDESITDGRPTDVLNFRNQLLADRLGIPLNTLPVDAAELTSAVIELDARGSDRLATAPILAPDSMPSDVDVAVWNPDGSRSWDSMNTNDFAAAFAAALALTDVEHAMVEG